MKCKECDTECKWLYYAKHDSEFYLQEDQMIQTDLWFCPSCETVYRQWIESTVHRDKQDVSIIGE